MRRSWKPTSRNNTAQFRFADKPDRTGRTSPQRESWERPWIASCGGVDPKLCTSISTPRTATAPASPMPLRCFPAAGHRSPRPRSVSEQLAPILSGCIRRFDPRDCLLARLSRQRHHRRRRLPHSILKADFKQAALCLPASMAQPVRAKAQADFAARLEGPLPPRSAGWLDWTLDLRNMLVHRGRRIELGSICRSPRFCLDRTASPHPRAPRITLPAIRGGQISSLHRHAMEYVLHEEGTRTLQGLMNSTVLLLEAAQGTCSISGGAARSSQLSSPARRSVEERAIETVDGLQRVRTRLAASRTQHGIMHPITHGAFTPPPSMTPPAMATFD